MDNKKILTISIAAYNVESFIRETLDSLVVNEVLDDIEVLVNDDGATDTSFDIAKEYQEKYPNTFKAIHKENAGYGSVFNYNIKIASGKYFKLLDGDDWFDRVGLIKLVSILKNNDVDIVFTQYNYATVNGLKLAIKYDEKVVDRILPIEEFCFEAGTPMHAITYKTNVLKESKVKLPEHILYTDNTYVIKPVINVNSTLFSNFVVYNYRLGLSGQSVSRESLVKHIDESEYVSIDVTKFYRDRVNNNTKSKQYLKVNVASTCVNYVVGVLKMPICKSSLNRLKLFDSEVKDISYDIYDEMGHINRKASKSLYLIRKTNYLLYWLFALIYRYIE